LTNQLGSSARFLVYDIIQHVVHCLDHVGKIIFPSLPSGCRDPLSGSSIGFPQAIPYLLRQSKNPASTSLFSDCSETRALLYGPVYVRDEMNAFVRRFVLNTDATAQILRYEHSRSLCPKQREIVS
jgi:hypothetical protein